MDGLNPTFVYNILVALVAVAIGYGIMQQFKQYTEEKMRLMTLEMKDQKKALDDFKDYVNNENKSAAKAVSEFRSEFMLFQGKLNESIKNISVKIDEIRK
jgi:uncharacterized membrane-anchored protein YhcB (DUF1043 family)